MTNIYIPEYTNECIVIQSNGVIRAYEQQPTYNSDIDYKDYYTNMDYIYNEGTQHLSNYSTLPVCRTGTNNIMYRVGINELIALIIIIIILLTDIIYKHLRRCFN